MSLDLGIKYNDVLKVLEEGRYWGFLKGLGTGSHGKTLLREELGLLPQRDPPKKFRFKLGTYNIRGCKVRLTEYGGEECGSFDIWPKSARVFKPGTYFYDFKGKRKQYFFETFRRERNKHGR